MAEKDFCVVDAGPLITFVTGGALDVLDAAGDHYKFKVLDVVAHEAGRRDKPGGIEVSGWIDKMKAEGRLDVIETEVGKALLEGRKANPNFRMKGAGEQAIAEWLHNGGANGANAAIVIYEDSDTCKLLESMKPDANVDAMTTRAFLMLGEKKGFVADADAKWQEMHAQAPTRTDAVHSFTVSRRSPAP